MREGNNVLIATPTSSGKSFGYTLPVFESILQSLKWFKEGALDKVAEYCEKDVEITRDLFLHGKDNQHLLFEKKGKGVVRLPVEWNVDTILEQIQQTR